MKTILLALLFLAGCSAPRGSHYALRIDPTLSVDDQASALAAVDDWHAATGAAFDVTISTCPVAAKDGEICIHNSSLTDMAKFGHFAGITFQQTDGGDVFVAAHEIRQGEAPECVQGVIAHEMGHAMGLVHTTESTLMYYTCLGGSVTVTPADAAQWRSLR